MNRKRAIQEVETIEEHVYGEVLHDQVLELEREENGEE